MALLLVLEIGYHAPILMVELFVHLSCYNIFMSKVRMILQRLTAHAGGNGLGVGWMGLLSAGVRPVMCSDGRSP